jgi:protein O-mannosyl-transferase
MGEAMENGKASARRGRPALWVCLLLVLATLFTYARVCWSDFVNYDDPFFVTSNPYVQARPSFDGVWWALTTTVAAHWHPLTWLSLQLDWAAYGTNAWGYHLTNLLFHCASAALLFLAIWRMTGAVWRSSLVAALFALHPLHVESVAWVSERKDVLSAFFWMLALWAYAGYAERPSSFRYLMVALAFGLGLMAKAMVVTLPCVLLLLDYWPLGRLALPDWRGRLPLPPLWGREKSGGKEVGICWLVVEKLPLLAMAAAASAITLVAQYKDRIETPSVGRTERIGSALGAYQAYLVKTVNPTELVVFYPHVGNSSRHGFPMTAALLLGGLTLLGLVLWRRPYLLVGWLWYLGTLVPVIGLVPIVGGHALADRYTYIPLIGIFLALSWGLADLCTWLRVPKAVPVAGAGLVVGACMAITWVQIGHWRDSKALWSHTLRVDPDNYMAHHNLGSLLTQEGALDEAAEHLTRAAAANPYGLSHYALANVLAHQGRVDDAIRYYSAALDINPNWPEVHKKLGALWASRGDFDKARGHYAAVLARNARDAEAQQSLAWLLIRCGELEDAARHFSAALQTDPTEASAHLGLGVIRALQGRPEESVPHCRRACELQPNVYPGHVELAHALQMLGKGDAARAAYERALRLDEKWPQATNAEAWRLATDPDAALRNGLLAVHLAAQVCEATGSQNPIYLDTLAAAYAEAGRFADAQATAEKAMALTSPGERRESLRKRLDLYRTGRAFHENRPAGGAGFNRHARPISGVFKLARAQKVAEKSRTPVRGLDRRHPLCAGSVVFLRKKEKSI